MKKTDLKKITLTAIFAALIAVATMFISIPTGKGYIHVGDSMVYLAGCLLGPYAAIAAALGGALSDIIKGYLVWAFPTAIIKACNSVPFIIASSIYIKQKKQHKIIHLSTLLLTLVSGLITVVGYFFAGWILHGFAYGLSEILGNTIQAVGSAIVFVLVGCALDAVKIQKYLK